MAFGLVALYWSEYRRLTTDIDEHGYSFTTARGIERLRPEVKAVNKALNDFLKDGAPFGLTPLGRAVHGLDASELGTGG